MLVRLVLYFVSVAVVHAKQDTYAVHTGIQGLSACKGEECLRYALHHYDVGEVPEAMEYAWAAIDGRNETQALQAMHILALFYYDGGEYLKAEALYEDILERKESAKLRYDYGTTLQQLGKIEQAAKAYYQAIELDPMYANAILNLAAMHQMHGNTEESIPLYQHVLALDGVKQTTRLKAMMNLGAAFEFVGDVDSSLNWFHRALELSDPVFDDFNQATVQVHIARVKRGACIWQGVEDDTKTLWDQVNSRFLQYNRSSPLQPFDTLLMPLTPEQRKLVATLHSTTYPSASQRQQQLDRVEYSDDKLHVGYLSYDFADHPTAHLLQGVFSLTNRDNMHVVALSYGRDDSSMHRQRVKDTCDEFVDLAALSTADALEAITGRKLDIIMDAQVHTLRSRLQLVAARPAPIIVNYLAYPGTSGASFYDYIIVDRFVAKVEQATQEFSENLVLLPHCYQVNHYESHEVSRDQLWSAPHQRKEDGGVVFVNFNKIDKLEPVVFHLWMRILERVPGSSLLLLDPVHRDSEPTRTSLAIKENLSREAVAAGVAPDRIRFEPRLDKEDHLNRHKVGDVFLDTLIYGAHSTATDALYAGLPVITMAGNAFASRVGVSLLSNLNVPELIAYSLEDYENLAVELAMNKAALDRVTNKVRKDDKKAPLFRTAQHTMMLEESQRLMFDLSILSSEPMHLVVRPGS